jgi:hypothetical protein
MSQIIRIIEPNWLVVTVSAHFVVCFGSFSKAFEPKTQAE